MERLLDFDPIVLISRNISWRIKSSFRPTESLLCSVCLNCLTWLNNRVSSSFISTLSAKNAISLAKRFWSTSISSSKSEIRCSSFCFCSATTVAANFSISQVALSTKSRWESRSFAKASPSVVLIVIKPFTADSTDSSSSVSISSWSSSPLSKVNIPGIWVR